MNKLWLFFILVAAGLIYSYSLVGKRYATRAERAIMPEEAPVGRQVLLLTAETGCRPLQGPCAAYARDAALVLQARRLGDSGELAVAVGEVGFPTSGLDGAELLLTWPDEARAYRAVYSAGGWKAVFPVAADPRRLEVRLRDRQRVWVAEFPLVSQ